MEYWRRAAIAPIHFYQRFLSPLKAVATCRFVPTCSEYAVHAIVQRGVFWGGWLSVWRILRCNPLCKPGYDPVSPARAEKKLVKKLGEN